MNEREEFEVGNWIIVREDIFKKINNGKENF
jgi:hypothetical protein